MKQKLLKFYSKQDRLIFLSFVGSVLVGLIVAILLGLTIGSLPKKVPLFYSLPWGESQLIASSQLFVLPALIILVSLVNLITSWQLHKSQLALKRIVNSSTIIFALLILITTIRIVHIFL